MDKLFAEYEAQAAADRARTEQKLKQSKQKPQKSMKEMRQEGLEQPIAADNKYGANANCTHGWHTAMPTGGALCTIRRASRADTTSCACTFCKHKVQQLHRNDLRNDCM